MFSRARACSGLEALKQSKAPAMAHVRWTMLGKACIRLLCSNHARVEVRTGDPAPGVLALRSSAISVSIILLISWGAEVRESRRAFLAAAFRRPEFNDPSREPPPVASKARSSTDCLPDPDLKVSRHRTIACAKASAGSRLRAGCREVLAAAGAAPGSTASGSSSDSSRGVWRRTAAFWLGSALKRCRPGIDKPAHLAQHVRLDS